MQDDDEGTDPEAKNHDAIDEEHPVDLAPSSSTSPSEDASSSAQEDAGRAADLPRANWRFSQAQEEQPWTLDDEQLRASGWEFRDQSFRRGSRLQDLPRSRLGFRFTASVT